MTNSISPLFTFKLIIKTQKTIAKDNACGEFSLDTKDLNLDILNFKQFYKYFVFNKNEEG